MEPWTAEDKRQFGSRLQKAREAAGLTQPDVGAMFDVGKGAVSAWETGKNTPTAEQLARMADEFQSSCDWLLYGIKVQPLSVELRQRLAKMEPEDLRRIENTIRAGLDMPIINKPVVAVPKKLISNGAP